MAWQHGYEGSAGGGRAGFASSTIRRGAGAAVGVLGAPGGDEGVVLGHGEEGVDPRGHRRVRAVAGHRSRASSFQRRVAPAAQKRTDASVSGVRLALRAISSSRSRGASAGGTGTVIGAPAVSTGAQLPPPGSLGGPPRRRQPGAGPRPTGRSAPPRARDGPATPGSPVRDLRRAPCASACRAPRGPMVRDLRLDCNPGGQGAAARPPSSGRGPNDLPMNLRWRAPARSRHFEWTGPVV